MISIFVYGLDQFLVGDLSREITKNLADVFETSEDEIMFVAPNDMVFHNGAEQTSWRVIVEVKLPDIYTKVQDKVKEVLFHYVSQVAVHVDIIFNYHFASEHFAKINEKYDLFLEEELEDSLDDETYQEELNEGEGEDEIYTGDIFEGVLNNEDEPKKKS